MYLPRVANYRFSHQMKENIPRYVVLLLNADIVVVAAVIVVLLCFVFSSSLCIWTLHWLYEVVLHLTYQSAIFYV